MQSFDSARVRWIIEQALAEDIGTGDVTTQAVVARDRPLQAEIISKAEGIVAGLPVAEMVFQTRDAALRVEKMVQEGELVYPGEVLLRIQGSGRSILEAERTALNLLGRLSGIATRTRRFVNAVAGTGVTILDTRKTAPLLRELDKYAVRIGGGQNHRRGLHDMILIKENHIRYAGGIEAALKQVLKSDVGNKVPVEVEIRDLEELQIALQFPVARLMLDNFDLETLKQAVELVEGRVPLEASGGVTLATVRDIAETGVEYISVGALTHSVTHFDLSLLVRG